jgi:nicotinamide-nucleotide amidase
MVFRGGVVAYATELKHELLGVDAGLLHREGPVDPDVAAQMALGVSSRLHGDWGLATTGVAGPGPQDGVPAGRVFVAVAGPQVRAGLAGGERFVRVARLDLRGDRAAIRIATVRHLLSLFEECLAEFGRPPSGGPEGPEHAAARHR